MDYNGMAAKRRKKPKRSFVYAPLAPFRGYSLLLIYRLYNGLLSNSGATHGTWLPSRIRTVDNKRLHGKQESAHSQTRKA